MIARLLLAMPFLPIFIFSFDSSYSLERHLRSLIIFFKMKLGHHEEPPHLHLRDVVHPSTHASDHEEHCYP